MTPPTLMSQPAVQLNYGQLPHSPEPSAIAPWQRPADWLELPPINAGEQMFAGLFAVFPGPGNLIALRAEGDYIVDWGDGNVEQISSPLPAIRSHRRWFGNNHYGPLERVVLVYRDDPDWAHYIEGSLQVYQNNVLLSPTAYRLEENETLNTIDVVLTTAVAAGVFANIRGTWDWGEPILQPALAEHHYNHDDLPAASQCSRGYRQVIVTVTPQPGAELSQLDLSARHSSLSQPGSASTAWLELRLSMPMAAAGNSIAFCQGPLEGSSDYLGSVEHVEILDAGGATSLENLLSNACCLQSFQLDHGPDLEDLHGMLSGCSNLRSVAIATTIRPLWLSSLFSGCSSLTTGPALQTATAQDMAYMFADCTALQQLPVYDTAAVTSMAGMFSGCRALSTLPLLDCAAVQDMGVMFYGCTALQTLPALDVSAVQNFWQTFMGCSLLAAVPLQGISISLSLQGCALGRSALLELFDGLVAVSDGQSLDISDNPGASELSEEDRQIATAKGWTLTY